MVKKTRISPVSGAWQATVPDVKHLASHGGSLAEHFLGQAFEGVHIMLFLALGCGQTTEGASAQIQGIEMPGRENPFIDEGIVTGRPVPVAVARIDVEILQLRKHRQLIGQRLLEGVGQELIDFLQEPESARAFERMEVMGKVRTVIQVGAMGLEESAARG